ncbi:hypothetical protein EVG20_g9500 [Dentipellis fragilis]|uniref:Uncharacterized protein n=1 Tax=Dentipellis fragilis TaxID=205917 RepID=A0A4Y9XZ39_9AGAM|nr:hypothetical protein EVG20_g9500 [Dentipellis fragilis]
MPAPSSDTPPFSPDSRALGHVNLMVDTFIANASIEDLRATIRTLLATTPPSTAAAFTRAARTRLSTAAAKAPPRSLILFSTRPDNGREAVSTQHLYEALAHARALYGAGMGFSSLKTFIAIVRATVGLRWMDDGEMARTLVLIDGDLCQAIQSAKEEAESGRAGNLLAAREKVAELRAALQESMVDVARWGVTSHLAICAAQARGDARCNNVLCIAVFISHAPSSGRPSRARSPHTVTEDHGHKWRFRDVRCSLPVSLQSDGDAQEHNTSDLAPLPRQPGHREPIDARYGGASDGWNVCQAAANLAAAGTRPLRPQTAGTA